MWSSSMLPTCPAHIIEDDTSLYTAPPSDHPYPAPVNALHPLQFSSQFCSHTPAISEVSDRTIVFQATQSNIHPACDIINIEIINIPHLFLRRLVFLTGHIIVHIRLLQINNVNMIPTF